MSAGGRRLDTWSDELGQMVVEPHCNGLCTIELKYDGGIEGVYGRAIHRIALAGGVLLILETALRLRPKAG